MWKHICLRDIWTFLHFPIQLGASNCFHPSLETAVARPGRLRCWGTENISNALIQILGNDIENLDVLTKSVQSNMFCIILLNINKVVIYCVLAIVSFDNYLLVKVNFKDWLAIFLLCSDKVDHYLIFKILWQYGITSQCVTESWILAAGKNAHIELSPALCDWLGSCLSWPGYI